MLANKKKKNKKKQPNTAAQGEHQSISLGALLGLALTNRTFLAFAQILLSCWRDRKRVAYVFVTQKIKKEIQ